MTGPAIAHDDRERIVDAFIEVVTERGYRATPLGEVLARARVDEASFHRQFTDLEECLVAAWDHVSDQFLPEMLAAYSSSDSWREQIRAMAERLLVYLTDHPDHARILYVEGGKAGGRTRTLLNRNMDMFAELVDLGRQELDDPKSLTRATAEGVVGAIYEQISSRLIRGADDELPSLLPQLMFMTVRPYLGMQVALEEMNRSA